MKLTVEQLRRIIKEETDTTLLSRKLDSYDNNITAPLDDLIRNSERLLKISKEIKGKQEGWWSTIYYNIAEKKYETTPGKQEILSVISDIKETSQMVELSMNWGKDSEMAVIMRRTAEFIPLLESLLEGQQKPEEPQMTDAQRRRAILNRSFKP